MLTDADRFWLCSAAYGAWCEAYDQLKAAKAATWDGKCPKGDWPLFHAHRLELATKTEAEAKGRLDRITAEFKDSIPTGF